MALSFGAMAGLSALSMLGSLGGYALGGASSSRAMKKQFEYNMALMDRQVAYQRMAHQFEVEDLKKAGLNPILSANGGQTVSPSGASASAVDNSSNMANTLTDGINTAVQNMVSARSVDNAKPVQEAQAKLFGQQSLTEQTKRDNIVSSTALNNAEADLRRIDKMFLPEQYKAGIKSTLSNSISNMISAKANSLSASANRINAETGKMNAETERMNAETNKVKAYKEDLLNKGIDFYRNTNWRGAMRDIFQNSSTGKHYYNNWSPLKKR